MDFFGQSNMTSTVSSFFCLIPLKIIVTFGATQDPILCLPFHLSAQKSLFPLIRPGLAQLLHTICSPTQLLATSTQLSFNPGTAFPSMSFELPPSLHTHKNKMPQNSMPSIGNGGVNQFPDRSPHHCKHSPNTLKCKN